MRSIWATYTKSILDATSLATLLSTSLFENLPPASFISIESLSSHQACVPNYTSITIFGRLDSRGRGVLERLWTDRHLWPTLPNTQLGNVRSRLDHGPLRVLPEVVWTDKSIAGEAVTVGPLGGKNPPPKLGSGL